MKRFSLIFSAIMLCVISAMAEAKYTQDMEQLERQDQKFDLESKKLDTEHNALQTEYDALKSVVDKNIEKAFNAFS